MAQTDFEKLLDEIDSIDTNVAVRGKLTPDERERLLEIINQVTPYFYGGTEEHVLDAMRVVKAAQKLLGTENDEHDKSNIDTTVCQLCGQTYTGTPEELDAWEKEHRMKTHGYAR